MPVKVITELAWHNLFAQNLFIRNPQTDQSIYSDWTVINAPHFKAQPEIDGTRTEVAVMIHLSQRRVLICGTHFAGEIKKSMFSVLNYLLPEQQILPMHCAANMGKTGDVALFFGLSGTGKTTLSADPNRLLIGDDEHGWHEHGVFNFEGGCYAKCINLSPEREPVIWHAIRQGAVMENVVLDPITNEPQFHDASLTQNIRAAYPREHIDLRVEENRGHQQPSAVLFLTCESLWGLTPRRKINKRTSRLLFSKWLHCVIRRH